MRWAHRDVTVAWCRNPWVHQGGSSYSTCPHLVDSFKETIPMHTCQLCLWTVWVRLRSSHGQTALHAQGKPLPTDMGSAVHLYSASSVVWYWSDLGIQSHDLSPRAGSVHHHCSIGVLFFFLFFFTWIHRWIIWLCLITTAKLLATWNKPWTLNNHIQPAGQDCACSPYWLNLFTC